MPAKRVNIPQKIALDELLATEVNEVAAAVNQHADALDNLAFVPLAAGQYGTHPAFGSRTELEAWLLTRLAGLATATPDAPIVSFDPASRMLAAASPLGSAEIEYSHAGDAYQAYQAFLVDNLAHAPGEWVFRTRAQAGRAASAPTNSPRIDAKAVGVVAPTVVYTSSTRRLTASHTLGGTLLFSYQGSAFVEYLGAIQVDDATHDAGEWRFKRAASTGYAESAVANSPAIAAAVVSGPTITSFTPASGPVGSTIVITGTGFTGATVVSINSGAVAGFTVDSATQITATLTDSQASGKVRVTTAAGTAVSAVSFTVGSTRPVFTPITDVIPFGNSQTAGFYPAKLQALCAGYSEVEFRLPSAPNRYGHPGKDIDFLIENYPTEIRPLRVQGRTQVVVLQEFTNSWPMGAATMKARWKVLCDLVRADGFLVLCLSPYPRANYTSQTADSTNPLYTDCYNWLLANYAAFSDGVADIRQSPYCNDYTDMLNPNVSFDGTHFNDEADILTAQTVFAWLTGARAGVVGVPDYRHPDFDPYIGYGPYPAPTISGFSPASAGVGEGVTIKGRNLGQVGTLTLAGKNVPVRIVDGAGTIRIQVPAGATSGRFVNTTIGGSATSATDFIVPGTTPPVGGNFSISSFSPETAKVGDSVTVTGAGFVAPTIFRFAGVPASSITLNSATQATIVVPAGAANGNITATNSANVVATSPRPFTLAGAGGGTGPAPTITSYDTNTGVATDYPRIYGSGFLAADGTKPTLYLGGALITVVIVHSDTEVQFQIPANARTGGVVLSTAGGVVNGPVFTIPGTDPATEQPAITSVNPTSMVTGTVFTVLGTNLYQVTNFTVGGVAVDTVVKDNPGQIRAYHNSPLSGVLSIVTEHGTVQGPVITIG